jgi:hypothetical protein
MIGESSRRGRAGVWGGLILVCASGGGCDKNISTPLSDAGVTAFATAMVAEWPATTAGAPPPETINVVSGTDGNISYAQGRGFVDATLLEAWAAMKAPDVCVDRRKVSSWTVTNDVDPTVAASYVIHNVVNSTITINFDNTWLHEATAGTREAPQQVTAHYQKTMGSSFIDLLDGSVVATSSSASPGATSIEIVQRIRATGQDASTAVQMLRDYFASLVARAHGAALPTY